MKIGDKIKLDDDGVIRTYTVTKPGMRHPSERLKENEVYLTSPGVMGFDASIDWINQNMIHDKMENGGNMKKTHMMENGGVIGQEIVFDDNGEENTGIIKDIHEITGNYIVSTDDGRTVLADKELDVISLGKIRKQEAKKRFSFFEDGGKMVKGGKTDSKSLFDLEYGDVFKIDRNPEKPHTMTSQYFLFIGFSEKYAKPEGVTIEAAYFPGSFYGPEYDQYKEHAYLSDLKNGDITIISKEEASEMLMDYYLNNNKFKDGGNIAKENNEMLHSQAKEAKHHIEELHNILTSKTKVEPWVVAKMTRAKTDLSDITHYLDGNTSKMAKGGKLTDAQQEKFNKVMHEWKQGKLHSGSANGPIVKDQDQAIAIAYSEAYGMDKMLFGGMINDLSDGTIDRMEGLVPISTLQELLDNAKFIIADMYEEGFEKDDIMSFLAYKISQIGGNKMATGGEVTSKEEKMIASKAKAIFRDLKRDGYDKFDLATMTEEEAVETVNNFSDVPDNLKKDVANYLFMLCQRISFEKGGSIYNKGGVSRDNMQGPILTFKGKSGMAYLYRLSTLFVILDDNGNEIARVVSTNDKSRRPDIKELQSKLQDAGFSSTPIEGSWEHTFTKEQIHRDQGRGFFGNIEKAMGYAKADEMFRETIKELKKNYGATEYGALNLLNSHYGSRSAKHIIKDDAKNGIDGLLLEWQNEPIALKKWVQRANKGYFNAATYENGGSLNKAMETGGDIEKFVVGEKYFYTDKENRVTVVVQIKSIDKANNMLEVIALTNSKNGIYFKGSRFFIAKKDLDNVKEYVQLSTGGGVDDVINGAKIELGNISDIDHTRIVKYINQFLDSDADVKKSKNGYTIDISKLSNSERNKLVKYLRSQEMIDKAYAKGGKMSGWKHKSK